MGHLRAQRCFLPLLSGLAILDRLPYLSSPLLRPSQHPFSPGPLSTEPAPHFPLPLVGQAPRDHSDGTFFFPVVRVQALQDPVTFSICVRAPGGAVTVPLASCKPPSHHAWNSAQPPSVPPIDTRHRLWARPISLWHRHAGSAIFRVPTPGHRPTTHRPVLEDPTRVADGVHVLDCYAYCGPGEWKAWQNQSSPTPPPVQDRQPSLVATQAWLGPWCPLPLGTAASFVGTEDVVN